MEQAVINFLVYLDDKLWIFATILIFLLGIYFTFKLKGLQFNIKRMIKELLKKEKSVGEINSFKALMLSLAGRIGVGSISGVALAIYLAGPGTIFWIWVISIFSSTLAYSEVFLGIKYKEKDENKIYKGGPAYYIKNGLNKPILGALYAIIIIICYGIGFMSVQSNTISKSITSVFNVDAIVVGIFLAILSFIIIFGGVKKIANVTSKVVPVMSLIYIVLAMYIVFSKINLLPSIFSSIIKSAFNFKSFTGGFLSTLLIGVQRGIFSNEAGIGTGSIAASSSGSKDAISQSYIQTMGVYITSFFICTATAIIILTSNYTMLNISDPNGIEIATFAFTEHLGTNGQLVLVICIFLFAFSTILSGYYYGESSLKYFFKKVNKKYITVLKLFTVLVIFTGSIASSTIAWKITDIFIAIICFINIYAMFKMRKEIKK